MELILFAMPVVGLVWTWQQVFQYGLDDMAIIISALLLVMLAGMLVSVLS